jgi:hypothetical protein
MISALALERRRSSGGVLVIVKRLILATTLALAVAPFAGAQTAAAACPAPGTGYAGAVSQTPGLVGYWRLGETSGTTACDATGTSDGTYKGGYTLGQPGPFTGDSDTAVKFDAKSASVDVPNANALEVRDSFTAEAWVKRATPGRGVWETVVSKQRGAFLMMFDGDDHLALRRSRFGTRADRAILAVSTTRVADHNWHYIAATKQGPDIHLYVDGVDVTAPIALPYGNRTMGASGLPLVIGKSSDTSFFDGSLDEIAVYNRPLTAAEIANHFAAAGYTPPPPPPPPPPTQGAKAIWGTLDLSNGQSAFPVYKDLGVQVFQYQLSWRGTATAKPANPTDPNDPAYQWPPEIQQAIDQGNANGISVALLVRQTPDWANGGAGQNKAPDNPQDYADFLSAARKKYPSVNRWMIWGETNRYSVWNSPEVKYAELLDDADVALKAVDPQDPGDNTVVGGMTFTYGEADNSPNPSFPTYPAHWIANMKLPNGDRPRFDEWGHNPFTHRCPDLSQPLSDNGARDISDLVTLREDLRVAFGTYKPMWLSEFSVSSDRANRSFSFYVDRQTQAYWITRAFEVAGHVGGVSGLGWFNIQDENAPDGLTLGLLDTSMNPKPAYAAYKAASLTDSGDPGPCAPGSVSPAPGSSAAALPDTSSPGEAGLPGSTRSLKISLSVKRKIRVRALLKRLGFALTSSEAGSATAVLRIDPAAARRTRLAPRARKKVLIGRKTAKVAAGRKKKLAIRLSRKARKTLGALRRGTLTLTVTVRTPDGLKAVKTVRIKVRR